MVMVGVRMANGLLTAMNAMEILLPYSILMVFGVVSHVLTEGGEPFHVQIATNLLQVTWILLSILLVLDVRMMLGQIFRKIIFNKRF